VPAPQGSPVGIQSTTLTAPIGGWNRRDSLATMPETDAIVMDNFISTGGIVKLRSGYRSVVETPKSPIAIRQPAIKTLCSFTAGTDDQLIFANKLAGERYSELYKIDETFESYESIVPKDAYGVPLVKMEGTRWKDLQFQNRLFLVSDGTDVPVVYDGKRLAYHSFENKTEDDLEWDEITDICAYNQRLFFLQKGTLNLWFTSAMGAIAGEIECNDLSNYATRGGELVEIEEWTRTGANDLTSMLVAITSEGEVFMFKGTDPTEVDEWEMAGVYQVPDPLGFHCATRMMDDLIIATKGGYYSAASLTSVKETTASMAITDKIRGAIMELKEYHDNVGWQEVFLPTINMFFINIPISESQAEQFVYNMENQTWSRFTGIDAFTFCTFKDKIYFGGKTGNIYELFETSTNNGLFISGAVQQAFSTFNVPQKKKIKSITVSVGTPFVQKVSLRLSCDFNLQPESVVFTNGVAVDEDTAQWDVSRWNEEYWGVYLKADQLDIQELSSPMDGKVARFISLAFSTSIGANLDFDVVWYSTTFAFETALQ
jgi:hypothetical protein